MAQVKNERQPVKIDVAGTVSDPVADAPDASENEIVAHFARDADPKFLAPNDANLATILFVCENLCVEIKRLFDTAGSIRNPVAQFRCMLAMRSGLPELERREHAWSVMHEMRRVAFANDPIRYCPCFSVPNVRRKSLWGTPF